MPTGRFAPSPTGRLHVGNLRTALLAWLFARRSGSPFLVRVDDLDPATSRREHEEGQLHDLAALGLDWDGEVVRSTERRAHHDEAIARLAEAGRTYPCWCSRREIREAASAPNGREPPGAYPGTCRSLSAHERSARERGSRPPAMRLRADGARVALLDRLHGPVEGLVDDLVLRRADGTPAYNLAVVVDDAGQGVGEVVRGDDLLTSTPRQLHLAALLELRPPAYAHVPLVLAPDGSRLAKRHGAVTLPDLAALGRTAEEVRGELAVSLGLADPDEAVTTAELLDRFDPDRLPREPWTITPPASARGGSGTGG